MPPTRSSGPTRERIAVVAPYVPSLTETFIRAHAQRLPADTLFLHGWRPTIGERMVLSFPERVYLKARRMAFGESIDLETTRAYVRAFRRHGTHAVLAEYGTTAVQVLGACRELGIPLIAHFHGFDASIHSVLDEWRDRYRVMFAEADAIVAVSKRMRADLIAMGAPAERVHWNPCGVDCTEFEEADPGSAPPVLAAVGRFTEKKGPTYTIRAFACALRSVPDARLRMLGGGPLFDEAKALVEELGIGHAVELLGPRPHEEVPALMRSARAFVQHSIVASNGDSEGTPVAVLEAGATGLPVIATRHAGIPDVVIEEETGLLTDEKDVDGMAAHMVRVLSDAELARRLGRAARAHVEANFSMERSLERLWSVIESRLREHAARPAAALAHR
jgi:glycosyltransferase involved in cell wall biosynthesis